MSASRPDFDRLRCPGCGGILEERDSGLACRACAAVFPVRDGVPDLLPAAGALGGLPWRVWRERLDALETWRRNTWDGTASSAGRKRVADDLAASFFAFARLPDRGTVLEIGCGSGELRRFVPGCAYCGVDPLAVAAGRGGDLLVRGVGERLPFADESFDALVVCETLDHALDPTLLVREARRVLKDGGVAAIMQNVQAPAPRASTPRRLRIAAGRLKARLLGRARMEDARTKMRFFDRQALVDLLGGTFDIESATLERSVLFLRARRPVAPRERAATETPAP